MFVSNQATSDQIKPNQTTHIKFPNRPTRNFCVYLRSNPPAFPISETRNPCPNPP